MVKMSKKVAIVIVIITMVAGVLSGCSKMNTKVVKYDVVEPTSAFYVNDFADILSSSEEEKMINKANEFAEKSDGIQVVITTVSSLEDCITNVKQKNPSIEDTAYAMYNQYGIGKDSMGVLVLLSVQDRDIRIEVGYSMESYITDGIAGNLIDEFALSYLREDQFAEGIISLQSGIIDYISQNVPADWNEGADETNVEKVNTDVKQETSIEKTDIWTRVASIVTVISMFEIIIIVFLYCKYKKAVSRYLNLDKEIANLQNEAQRNYEDLKQRYEARINENNFQTKAKIDSLNQSMSSLRHEKEESVRRCSEIENKLERIRALHPENDFDQEVQEMIEREYKMQAQSAEQEISSRYHGEAGTHENYLALKATMKIYQSLSDEEKKYYTCNETIKQLRSALSIAKSDFEAYNSAKEFELKLQSEFGRIGRQAYEHHKNILRTLEKSYQNLSSGAKAYIPTELIDKLNMFIKEAEEDSVKQENERRRRQEEERKRREEERRRREEANRYHSSFSRGHHSSSSFHSSGFGGRSHGGGATRHF